MRPAMAPPGGREGHCLASPRCRPRGASGGGHIAAAAVAIDASEAKHSNYAYQNLLCACHTLRKPFECVSSPAAGSRGVRFPAIDPVPAGKLAKVRGTVPARGWQAGRAQPRQGCGTGGAREHLRSPGPHPRGVAHPPPAAGEQGRRRSPRSAPARAAGELRGRPSRKCRVRSALPPRDATGAPRTQTAL